MNTAVGLAETQTTDAIIKRHIAYLRSLTADELALIVEVGCEWDEERCRRVLAAARRVK